MNHPCLSALSLKEQRMEIWESKQGLGGTNRPDRHQLCLSLWHSPVLHRGNDWLVERTGFTNACSNFRQRIGRQTDLFQIPRFIVRDWDGDEFMRRCSMRATVVAAARMKILHVNQSDRARRGCRHLLRSASGALLRRGHESAVLVGRQTSELPGVRLIEHDRYRSVWGRFWMARGSTAESVFRPHSRGSSGCPNDGFLAWRRPGDSGPGWPGMKISIFPARGIC